MLAQVFDWLIKFIIVAIIVAIGVALFFLIRWAITTPLTTRCLQCQRKKALKKTGATRGGGWFKGRQVEWRCKYCGYCRWENKYRDVGDI